MNIKKENEILGNKMVGQLLRSAITIKRLYELNKDMSDKSVLYEQMLGNMILQAVDNVWLLLDEKDKADYLKQLDDENIEIRNKEGIRDYAQRFLPF